jgi:type II secretory pathway predicted ATPase ExeA
MYQHFYGLHELPFELTPNPKYLFLTSRHREALSTLHYGLRSAKPITVLIGEAGTGKTTLLHAALQPEQCGNVGCVYLKNPALTRSEFVELLAHRFDLGSQAGASKAVLLTRLEQVLKDRQARGQITALVIDEAQSLSGELLEEVRLLANSETDTQRLLPVVLAGQPELRDRLNEPGLRQLKQRVTLRCEIAPFNLQETAGYIAQRIRTAGGDAARLFTRQAVILIHERSAGIPRTISVMCDNALLSGFGLGRRPVDYEIVLEVAHDFDLGGTEMRSGGFGSEPSRQEPPSESPVEHDRSTLAGPRQDPLAEMPAAPREDAPAETAVPDDRSRFAAPRQDQPSETPVADDSSRFAAPRQNQPAETLAEDERMMFAAIPRASRFGWLGGR